MILSIFNLNISQRLRFDFSEFKDRLVFDDAPFNVVLRNYSNQCQSGINLMPSLELFISFIFNKFKVNDHKFLIFKYVLGKPHTMRALWICILAQYLNSN